jgi:hypothetical protein
MRQLDDTVGVLFDRRPTVLDREVARFQTDVAYDIGTATFGALILAAHFTGKSHAGHPDTQTAKPAGGAPVDVGLRGQLAIHADLSPTRLRIRDER